MDVAGSRTVKDGDIFRGRLRRHWRAVVAVVTVVTVIVTVVVTVAACTDM